MGMSLFMTASTSWMGGTRLEVSNRNTRMRIKGDHASRAERIVSGAPCSSASGRA